jgi:hypothetical protein
MLCTLNSIVRKEVNLGESLILIMQTLTKDKL